MKDFNKCEVYIEFSSQCVEIGEIPDDMKRNPYEDRNVLPSEQAAEAHLALMQLHQLRDCYRQGWTPNYTDVSNKFCIVHCFNSYLQIAIYATIPHFLSFQSEEIAKEFLNNFKDLIEQAGDLI